MPRCGRLPRPVRGCNRVCVCASPHLKLAAATKELLLDAERQALARPHRAELCKPAVAHGVDAILRRAGGLLVIHLAARSEGGYWRRVHNNCRVSIACVRISNRSSAVRARRVCVVKQRFIASPPCCSPHAHCTATCIGLACITQAVPTSHHLSIIIASAQPVSKPQPSTPKSTTGTLTSPYLSIKVGSASYTPHVSSHTLSTAQRLVRELPVAAIARPLGKTRANGMSRHVYNIDADQPQTRKRWRH